MAQASHDVESEPWKKVLDELWTRVTRGRRWLAMTIVVVALVVPGAYGVGEFYVAAVSAATERFWAGTTVATADEGNLMDEWVAVVSTSESKADAEAARDTFKNLYVRYETQLRNGTEGPYPVWKNDIQVARDPNVKARWIVAIDTFYGPSSESAVSVELARLSRLGGDAPEAQNTIQRQFANSRTLCYSKVAFERTHGRLSPAPNLKTDEAGRPYPSCDEHRQ